jgi:hypothetical protein
MTDAGSNGRVPGGGKWSEHEKERGMVAVALCSDNTHRAARLLAEQGLKIPRSTLQYWINQDHTTTTCNCDKRRCPSSRRSWPHNTRI